MNAVDWLKNHWPIFLALLAVGTAWGQQQNKIATLEQTVREQAAITVQLATLKDQTNTSITTIKEQNARIEERIKIILEYQEKQYKAITGKTYSQTN